MRPEHIILLGFMLFCSLVIAGLAHAVYKEAILMKKWNEDYKAQLQKDRLLNMRRLQGEVVKQPRTEARMSGFDTPANVFFLDARDQNDKKTST